MEDQLKLMEEMDRRFRIGDEIKVEFYQLEEKN